jgi:hypothetical protein
MARELKFLVAMIGLAVACGGSNKEPNSANDMNTAGTPGTPSDSAPEAEPMPSDGSGATGGTMPGEGASEPPPAPTSLAPRPRDLADAKASLAMPAEPTNAGKKGMPGGKSGTGGTSPSGGTSSKGGTSPKAP